MKTLPARSKRPDECLIAIRVQPGSKRNELLEWREGTLWMKIAAPPKENKANEAVIAFLAELLRLPKSSITIKNGLASKHKVISIEGMTEDKTKAILRTTLF